MLAQTIKYTDYNGNEREEKFYFNLSKAELMEMQLTTDGGYDEFIKRIVEAQDTPEIVKTFKKIILKSYGVKSEDGKRFIKSEELSTEFSQTEAYSELFLKLGTDAEAAAAFINGVMPKDIINEDKPVIMPVE